MLQSTRDVASYEMADVAESSGPIGMELQEAMTIFTVNIKGILKLMS
ncbi:hypothetical protein KQI76_04750 [Amphibacillus sp. MSJ-3]|nr:hypothetical protein [Amphibacillus sp. MSJ-3]MBU5594466.1 hypothetical protein [Amphibacillus sp. MSJ-3]